MGVALLLGLLHIARRVAIVVLRARQFRHFGKSVKETVSLLGVGNVETFESQRWLSMDRDPLTHSLRYLKLATVCATVSAFTLRG